MSLKNIRIVMVETSHPGNIGSAARAMMTMGLDELSLVGPKFFPHSKAHVMASGADEILHQAKVVDGLSDALAGCQLVIGTSARNRRYVQWPMLDSRECGQFVAGQAIESKVAIVFGRENSGLTNEELELCHYLVTIPVNPDFGSLNVASAVQVLGYEISMAMGSNSPEELRAAQKDEVVSSDEMEAFYEHLEKTLIEVRYLDPERPRLLMRRLRCLYGRVQMTRSEFNMMRGILSACQGRKFQPRKDLS